MAKNKMQLDEIDRQTSDLAGAIKSAIDELTSQIAGLQSRYDRLTAGTVVRRGPGRPKGSSNASSAEPKAAKPGKKKRIRRTRDQLAKTAEEIFAFVKKGGSDGVKGSAIKKEFGTLLPSIKEFLKTYGGKTIKTKGQKAAMTYHND